VVYLQKSLQFVICEQMWIFATDEDAVDGVQIQIVVKIPTLARKTIKTITILNC